MSNFCNTKHISKEILEKIDKFLFSLHFSKEQYFISYPSWAYGGHAWNKLQQGGTGIMNAIMWYQHIKKPGSKEWRPSIIIRALIDQISNKEFSKS